LEKLMQNQRDSAATSESFECAAALARLMHRHFDIGGRFCGTRAVLALGRALIYE
jgi:hypothetical protein